MIVGKEILRLAGLVGRISVHHQHLALALDWLPPSADQEGCGDARSVEQVGSHSDDGLNNICFQHGLPYPALCPTTKQYAVRYDDGHDAIFLKACQHVLN